jgi:hypothetical protein
MPTKLPEVIISPVIQQWLKGISRDDIATECGISAGAVTHIVNQWRGALGSATADELRDLATSLKKIGITSVQCALGFRVAMIMIKMGVKEDNFESFILDIYNRCKDLGLLPEVIADHLKDLVEFTKTTMPLLQLPNYLKQKADEKKKLEQEIQKLKGQIELLSLEKFDSENRRDVSLETENMTASELKWYSQLRTELRKDGIPVDDISKFAKTVNGIRQYGYDVGKVTSEFSDSESRRIDHKLIQDSMLALEKKYNYLKQQSSLLEFEVNSHSQTISVYKHLEDIQFGLKQLKLLWHTINEIAAANNIPPHEASQKFYKDIEEQYDNKLGFESKVEKLQFEVTRLSQEESKLRMQVQSQPLVGPVLIRLIQSGVKEQDIINMASLLERNIGGSSIDMQLLITKLDKYGGIKSNIQKLNQEEDK